MMEKFAPVAVRWLDANTDHNPGRSSDYAKTWQRAERCTIGWLVHYDRERIVLAMDDDRRCEGSEEDVQTVTTIPAAFILEVVEFRAVPKPKKKQPKQVSPRR